MFFSLSIQKDNNDDGFSRVKEYGWGYLSE